MNQITSHLIINLELAEGAILNELMDGFREDYLVLHCLLRKYNPATILEIGTHIGTGTNIICNALPDAKVYSLDLPESEADKSQQHPLHKTAEIGEYCTFPYTQLLADSLKFDYSAYQFDAFFIDGEHDRRHVYHETRQAILNGASLIIWHDADISGVYNGITDAFDMPRGENYNLYRVTDTRIAYATKK